jgi:tRNA(Ile)-lysidine synthase
MPDDPRRGEHGAPLLRAVRAAVARHGLLAPSEHVLVAVSGGPDSVALLHALVCLAPACDVRLTVCHVHHGLRPEADRDAAFVERLAQRFGVPVRVVRVDATPPAGRSPEEAARLARHAALERVARETGADRIALGHTADDQAETVLMRLLQGAGPRGLAGIPVRRGRIVRPLLEVDRAAVEAYLLAEGLPSVEDATNRDPKFLRNRIRHELLPALEAHGGPRVREALRRVARASREAVEALDALVRPRLAGRLVPTPVGWRLDLLALADLPPGALKAAVRLAVAQIGAPDGPAGGLRAVHLDALAALVSAPAGACVRLAGGLAVERGRDALWFLGPAAALGAAALGVPGRATVGAWEVTASLEAAPGDTAQPGRVEDSTREVCFDVDALAGRGPAPAVLTIRPRRAGERMIPFGRTGPVRLASLLATAGVPRRARAGWPVVAEADPPRGGGTALWLLGIRRAAAAPITPQSRTVLRLRARGRTGDPARAAP